MDESLHLKISNMLNKFSINEDLDPNVMARCNEVLSLVTTIYPKIQFLKISNTVLFEAIKIEHIKYDDLLIEQEDSILKEIASMEPIVAIIKFCFKDADNDEDMDDASLIMKIVINKEFPEQKPVLTIESFENLCAGKMNQFSQFMTRYFQDKTNDSRPLFEFLYDCNQLLNNFELHRFNDVDKTIVGNKASSRKKTRHQRRITSNAPKSIFSDRRPPPNKMIRVVIGENEESPHRMPINLVENLKFEMRGATAPTDLRLFDPVHTQTYYEYGPIVFHCNISEYNAVEVKKSAKANSNSKLPADSDSKLPADSDSKLPANTDSKLLADSDSKLLADSDSKLLANSDSMLLANSDSMLLANSDSMLPANSDSKPPGNANSKPPMNSKSNYFRVTIVEFDLMTIKDKYPEAFKKISAKMKSGLKFMNDGLIPKRHQPSTIKTFQYYFIKMYPIDDHGFKFVLVKDSLPTSHNDVNYYTFEEFVQISAIGQKLLSTNNLIPKYLMNMFVFLCSLHEYDLYHGDFDVKKIFLTNKGHTIVFDSYCDTLVRKLIPTVVKQAIIIIDSNNIKVSDKEIDMGELARQMRSNDIFNFGLFAYFLYKDHSNSVTDFDLFKPEHRNSQEFQSVMEGILTILDVDLRRLIRSCLMLEEDCRPEKIQDLNGYEFIESLKNKSRVVAIESKKDNEFLDTVNRKYSPRLHNEFRVISRLGKGGFGTVIKAHRQIEGESAFYAIKMCKFRRNKLQASILETRFLSQLNHPNVVRYYSCWFEYRTDVDHFLKGSSSSSEEIFDSDPSSNPTFESSNQPCTDLNVFCIQMELCENPTLASYLSPNFWNELPKPKKDVFAEIISGLAYIHEHTIIHRDLKPNNIFFDSNNRVKIGDFGLSCLCPAYYSDKNRKEKPKELTYDMGTALYTAPETHKNTFFNKELKIKGFHSDEPYTTKVDIYSLGIILFELCYPFQTSSERNQVLKALRQKKPVFPKDFLEHGSQEDKELISRLLSYDPADRPTSMELHYFHVESKGEKPIDAEIMKKILKVPTLMQQMVEMLFNEKTSLSNSFIDSRYDSLKHDLKTDEIHINDSYYNKILKIQLVKTYANMIAGIYGAADIPIPSLIPKTQLEPKTGSMVDMRTCCNWYVMDQNGIVVSLPYHIRAQLAAHVASSNTSIVLLRRSSIDKCFMQMMDPYAIQEIHEITFDLIWPKDWSDKTNPLLPYCEILGFSFNLLVYFAFFVSTTMDCRLSVGPSNIPSGIQVSFYITNMTILRSVLEFLHLSSVETKKIIHLLADHDVEILKQDYDKFQRNFRMVLDQVSESKMQCIFELIKIIISNDLTASSSTSPFMDSISKVLCKFSKKVLVSKFMKKIAAYYEEMKNIVFLTQTVYFELSPRNLNGPDDVKFVYTFGFISKNSFFYDHLLINVVIQKNDDDPITIGYGGRYDHLIENFMKKEDLIQTEQEEDDEDGQENFSAYRSAVGISFDLHDLCNLIPNDGALDRTKNLNPEFIESCQKYMANQINTMFPTVPSSNRMATIDIMICSTVMATTDCILFVPILTLVHDLRKKGVRVAMLPEVSLEDFIKVKSGQISNSRLNWCLDQDVQWIVIVSIDKTSSAYCFQRIRNFVLPCGHTDKNWWRKNWSVKLFREFRDLSGYLLEKLPIMEKRTEPVEKRNQSSSRNTSVDNRSIETTGFDHSSLDIVMNIESKRLDRGRCQEMLKSELKRITFLDLANLKENLKLLAFDMSPSVIRAITENVHLSRVQAICQQFKDRTNVKIKTLVSSFTENIVGKDREMIAHRSQIEKCVGDICVFFATKYFESPDKRATLILFPVPIVDQYRIIFA